MRATWCVKRSRAACRWSGRTPTSFAVVAENGLIVSAGWATQDPAFEAIPRPRPGWFVAAVWCVIYPMWGLARWRSHLAGEAGRRAAWWVVALMAWGLAYPIVTGGFQVVPSAMGTPSSLLLALVTAWRVARSSRRRGGAHRPLDPVDDLFANMGKRGHGRPLTRLPAALRLLP